MFPQTRLEACLNRKVRRGSSVIGPAAETVRVAIVRQDVSRAVPTLLRVAA